MRQHTTWFKQTSKWVPSLFTSACLAVGTRVSVHACRENKQTGYGEADPTNLGGRLRGNQWDKYRTGVQERGVTLAAIPTNARLGFPASLFRTGTVFYWLSFRSPQQALWYIEKEKIQKIWPLNVWGINHDSQRGVHFFLMRGSDSDWPRTGQAAWSYQEYPMHCKRNHSILSEAKSRTMIGITNLY